MREGPSVVRLAAALGERARVEMLSILMNGCAMTATELARAVGVTKQTASSHLRQLVDMRLVRVESTGRHRYFAIYDADIAHLIEGMIDLSSRSNFRVGPRDPALRKARVCYDHLAGELAVQMYAGLQGQGAFEVIGGSVQLSARGKHLFESIGIDVDAARAQRRAEWRACVDWSERKHHLAGALGAALWLRLQELGWAKIERHSRVVRIHKAHELKLRQLFQIR